MGQSRPLFVYFRPFLITISIIQIEKSVVGVLGIRTRAAGWSAQMKPRSYGCHRHRYFFASATIANQHSVSRHTSVSYYRTKTGGFKTQKYLAVRSTECKSRKTKFKLVQEWLRNKIFGLLWLPLNVIIRLKRL